MLAKSQILHHESCPFASHVQCITEEHYPCYKSNANFALHFAVGAGTSTVALPTHYVF